MKKVGFTLIEIIVVISIIAVLLAISVPLFASAKARARELVCQNHVRQIGVAFNLYHETHDSFPSAFVQEASVPDALNNIGNNAIDWRGLWWFYYLDLVPREFSTEESIMRCPSKKLTELTYRYNDLWGNYGVNWSVCRSPTRAMADAFPEFSGPPEKLTSIKHPGDTLLLADSGYSILAWVHTLPDSHAMAPKTSYEAFNQTYVPGASVNKTREESLWSGLKEDALTGRHPDKSVNCLFTDGHIAKKKADDLAVVPMDHGQIENLTPLWKAR